MLKKMKNNKKGFTLVELIVVLVILAILAALLIPALTGYIDKAKEKSIVAETRQVVMAAQTLVDESYGTKVEGTAVKVGVDMNDEKFDVTYQQIADLAEVEVKCITEVKLNEATADTKEIAGTKVASVKYTKNGRLCTYDATTNQYTVTKATK